MRTSVLCALLPRGFLWERTHLLYGLPGVVGTASSLGVSGLCGALNAVLCWLVTADTCAVFMQ